MYNGCHQMRFKACGAMVLGLVAAAVAGCASDNNQHIAGACGDGVVDSGEQCDDGNTVSGDGCSSVCKTETAGSICGDGTIDVALEACDDGNTTNGDGCSSDCRVEVQNPCGNGTLDTGETCDDGNSSASDGCSVTCQVEMGFMCTGSPSVCTVIPVVTGTCATPILLPLTMSGSTYSVTAMGDTSTSTNQVAAAACDTETTSPLPGGGHDQVFTFTNPVAQKVVITLNSHIVSASAFDGLVRLTTTACDVTTQVPDNDVGGAPDGCSDRFGSSTNEVLTYTSLAAGTYSVVVDGYSSTATGGAYSLTIQAGTPTCGNGIVEAFEACDDHNTAASDGCSAACTVEAGFSCAGSPSVCTVLPGGCANPGTITLALVGTTYDGMVMSDTSNAVSGVPGGACDGYSTAGAGPDQTWMFVNPIAQHVTISLDGSFDATLRLTTAACSLATSVAETELDPGIASDGCAEQESTGTAEVLNYPKLPAGTYYVLADGYSSSSKGTYTVTVHGGPSTCGN
ncbi:hypothetical protein BH11MYX1_BH11MYX1_07040 [soil metagenome]